LKNFDEAVECCLRLDNFADALIIALSSGDTELLEKTQARYFNKLPKDSPIHFVERLSRNKLRELVAQSDIDEWKCTLAIICSYASDDNEFYQLCSDLGDLLAHCGQKHAANLCYICANDIINLFYYGMKRKGIIVWSIFRVLWNEFAFLEILFVLIILELKL